MNLFQGRLSSSSSPSLSWIKSASKITKQLKFFDGTEGEGTCYTEEETWSLKEVSIHYLPPLKL